jgi:hypothetical protein
VGLFKLFKKATDSPIAAVQKTFLDQFPIWSIRHSQKLAHELAGVTLNEQEEAILIDCLAGGHVVYLSFSLPQEVISLLGGPDKLTATMSSWPQRAKSFFMVASRFIKHRPGPEKDALIGNFEKLFKPEKKYEPLAVYLATVTTTFIENESKQFSPSPFVLTALYALFFRLGDEQLEWLSNNILDHAMKSST